MLYIGEFAAIGTAIAFAFGSTLFTISGREIGSPLVNRTRLMVALLFVVGLHWALYRQPLPVGAAGHALFWLGLSGFVGLALGDAALFQAFVLIGPRLSMLMMSLAPGLSVLFAWAFLGERLTAQELAGILLVIGGIGVVVTERRGRAQVQHDALPARVHLLGLLLAFGGATGQAGGAVLAKVGLENDFPALSGNLIRITAALVAVWLFTIIRGQAANSFRTLRAHPRALGILSIAAFIGPTIGVWLSLIALQNTSVGVATTLMSLTPIFLIPVGYVVFKEQITWQSVVGTLVAFGGTMLLFI